MSSSFLKVSIWINERKKEPIDWQMEIDSFGQTCRMTQEIRVETRWRQADTNLWTTEKKEATWEGRKKIPFWPVLHNNRRHITQHVAPPTTTTNQGRKKEKEKNYFWWSSDTLPYFLKNKNFVSLWAGYSFQLHFEDRLDLFALHLINNSGAVLKKNTTYTRLTEFVRMT
jgi:hypothetical protein